MADLNTNLISFCRKWYFIEYRILVKITTLNLIRNTKIEYLIKRNNHKIKNRLNDIY